MSDLLLSSSDLTNLYVTLNSIKTDIEHIKKTVDKTDLNVTNIKDFIGYVENVSEAKPGIHEKFKSVYDRITSLEHFRIWITTSCTILTLAAGYVANVYLKHQKDFSIHQSESYPKKEAKIEIKQSKDLAHK